MKRKLRTVLLMTGSFSCTLMMAQPKKQLSLKEALDLSVQNSNQLRISQAKIEEANAVVAQAEEKKLPDASVMGSYLWLGSANIDLKNKDNSGGGTANPPPKVSQAMYGIANLSLPVYAGSRIKYGIESSKYLAQAAKLDAENDKEGIIQNTLEAYVNLYKARTAVRLVNENLSQSRQRVKELTDLEKNGILPRNDLLKAELQSSNVELSLLDAQNNLQLANYNMDLMLGLPDSTELMLDSAGIAKGFTLNSLADYLQLASGNRKDLASLDLRKKASETGEKITRGEYYPSLQLTGGYIAANIPKVLSITNAVNVGVGVSYSISSLWKTKSKIQEAEARTKQIVATEALLTDNIKSQVNKRYLDVITGEKKIEVYRKAVEQATEAYRVVKNKFDNNLATTSELLEADVALLQARLSYTLAQADAYVAYNRLLLSTGTNSVQ
jgi:outer membrane protein